MFSSVLIANRGEVAVRIARTVRELGIRVVAVYSDADAGAPHVRAADEAVRLGPAAARQSYLDIDRVVAAALATGAEAVHPGYGFLAENAALAEACAAAGLCFVGPSAAAIDLMGDKIRARAVVAAAGVPVVPGSGDVGLGDEDLARTAMEIGLPVLIKPSAGGGGKGMHLVTSEDSLRADIASARREAAGAFGDDTLFVERFIQRPRHIEVQVVADEHGSVVHLGERECSLQRRHQKIIEETPSPLISESMRSSMGAQAVAVARACGYSNLGTVEFIVAADDPEHFYFIEMNTRLQVEHPVTELVYDVDLVELQLRIAAGERLPWAQDEASARRRGHAVEARLYAEDPGQDFLPTGGTVLSLREPGGAGVRVDSGIVVGSHVGSSYDPMLSKIIAHGPGRAESFRQLDAALSRTSILGVTTNVGFLRRLLTHPRVLDGDIDTELIETADGLTSGLEAGDDVLAVAVVTALASGSEGSVWARSTGWRLGGGEGVSMRVRTPGRDSAQVRARSTPAGWHVSVGDGPTCLVTVEVVDGVAWTSIDGAATRYDIATDGDAIWLGRGGEAWLIEIEGRAAIRTEHGLAGSLGPVRSPMPGVVIAIPVEVGQAVACGDVLAVVEAMKMEHSLRATVDGVVDGVHVQVGQQVAIDAPLVTVAAREESSDG